MTPQQPDLNTVAQMAKIEHSLARIAHAIEAMAKQSVPNFKDLGETIAAQKVRRRPPG